MTLCKGANCLLKDECKRFTPLDENSQWFVEELFEIKDGVFSCEMFWGVNSQYIFETLKKITGGSYDST